MPCQPVLFFRAFYFLNSSARDIDARTMKSTAAVKHKSNKSTGAAMPVQNVRSVRQAKSEKLSQYVKPMLASIHEKAFNDPEWLFEIKWDGYRAIAETGKSVRLYSRNGLSFLGLYPKVAEELKKIKANAILDGEIIALNENQKPDFQKLQQYGEHRSLQLVYYIFDCLMVHGKSTLHLPLAERKEIARQLIPESNIVRYADHVEEAGVEFFTKAVEMDLEGIIAKRAKSIYVPGKRTSDWLKIKNHNTQEAIIAGFTLPRRSRQYFGALILGIMQNGKLKYIGHTGTGFGDAALKTMYAKLKSLTRKASPFEQKIVVNSPVTWVEPVLVCNVKYTEVTQDGILRHPVFMGLRIDKKPEEVTTLDKPAKSKSSRNRKAKA
jgi:bifunctional non-homologous end joining protein LigD